MKNDLRKKIRYIVYSKFPLRAFKMEDLNEGIDQLLSLFQEENKKVVEGIEKIFDKYRSSSQVVKGKRRFGVTNFKIGARDIYNDIKQMIPEKEKEFRRKFVSYNKNRDSFPYLNNKCMLKPLEAFLLKSLKRVREQAYEKGFEEASKQKRIIQKLYLEERKKVLTEVIELLEKMRYVKGSKELEIYTVNPLILELKALRGDFKPKGER